MPAAGSLTASVFPGLNRSNCCTLVRPERGPDRSHSPPSTTSVTPVMKRGRVGARGTPPRPRFRRSSPSGRAGIAWRLLPWRESVTSRRTPSVPSTGPGARPFTRMPDGPHSAASERVSESMPAFAADACDCPIVPSSCSVALMLSTTPPPRLQMRKRRARDVEGAFQIDVDHGAEPVGRQVLGQRDEVARGAVDEDVQAVQAPKRCRRQRPSTSSGLRTSPAIATDADAERRDFIGSRLRDARLSGW